MDPTPPLQRLELGATYEYGVHRWKEPNGKAPAATGVHHITTFLSVMLLD